MDIRAKWLRATSALGLSLQPQKQKFADMRNVAKAIPNPIRIGLRNIGTAVNLETVGGRDA